MTIIYDAVTVTAIPADAEIILAYIDGAYVTLPAVQRRFPTKRILTVTTTGLNAATLCDVESGDATPATAAVGVAHGLYETVYSDVTTKTALDGALATLSWNWFSANPTGVPHLVAGSVATQYAWASLGQTSSDYDMSITNGIWPTTPHPPTPHSGETTMPVPTDTIDAWFVEGSNGANGFELHADGGLFSIGNVTDGAITYVAIANDGTHYHFGPNGDHTAFCYPALPASARQGTRYFTRMVVLAYAGKAV